MRDKYKILSFPKVDNEKSAIVAVNSLALWVVDAARAREIDLQDYRNQVADNPKIYPQPSSSSDLFGTEKIGDVAYGTDTGTGTEYAYFIVDNAGTLQWQRVALGTF